MSVPGFITLIVILAALVLLVKSRRDQDVILWGAVSLLVLLPVPTGSQWQLGVLSVGDALQGFANEGVVTIALLFVVAAGMRETGALRLLSNKVFGRPRTLIFAQNRIVWPTALLSAFLNNTPLVAMLLPATDEWAKRYRFSIAKLLLPLSYASILGGACTLIGTSTNLIVNGWLIETVPGSPGFGLFSMAVVAVPIAIVGLIITLVSCRWLLQDRVPPLKLDDNARQYVVEMVVEEGSELVNKTIEAAGLRNLPGLFLIEVDRNSEIIPAVSGTFQLQANDQLIFAGIVESVVDLQKIRGLRPATNQVFKLNQPRENRTLMEAVVSDSCPVAGRSIREGKFRTRYNAAVIAVARNGERIDKKIGDIVLQPGDTLLLETRKNFVEQQRNRRDFYLVSQVDNSTAPNYVKAPLAIAILLGLVVIVTTGLLSMLQAALLACGLILITGCCSPGTARNAVDWQILLVLAAALAVGKAMEVSGLAEALGHGVVTLFDFHPTALLAAVFALTAVMAACVTSKTAALLMLPISFAAAVELQLNVMPFVVTVMIAAATTVATPIGYPTNLMIYGPGGYRFSDYLRIGIPVTLAAWLLSVLLIPVFWPFY